MPDFDTLTSRNPNGLTNAAPWQTMGAAGTPDPTWAVQYANDFISPYQVADWVRAIPAGATGGSLSGVTMPGGFLSFETSEGATDANAVYLQWNSFQIRPGKATFFKTRLLATTGVVSEVGLMEAFGTPVPTATNGITIGYQNAQVPTLNLYTAGVKTSVSFPASCVAGAANDGGPDSHDEVGFMVDWQGNIAAFFRPTTGGSANGAAVITAANVANGNHSRGPVATFRRFPNNQGPAYTLPPNPMTPWIHTVNTAAGGEILNIDYIVASCER